MTIAIDTIGLHPASVLCLEAMHWLHEKTDATNILEIGCGNGILSVAAASIWGAKVIAADISPNAVADTTANIARHGLEAFITAVRSDGFDHPEIRQNAPYDLILCNVLAELLARLGPDIKKSLKTNGYIIMSGILAWKAPELELAYKGLGFEIAHKISNSPWNCYILCHNCKT
jgi:ribosomal protein L11 methyltransferase